MANRITNRDFFNAIRSNADIMTLPQNITADTVREWVDHQLELLDRKNVNKKPTKEQEQTAVLMDTVSQFLAENRGKAFTCADLIAANVFPAGTMSQRASAVCNNLWKAQRCDKGTLKNKTVFMASGSLGEVDGVKEFVKK